MSDPIRFLVSFGQAVSTMALYNDGHPARERAVDGRDGPQRVAHWALAVPDAIQQRFGRGHEITR